MTHINILYPDGGLCNRLRAIAGVLKLTDSQGGEKPVVLWAKGPHGCNAYLSELFDIVELRKHIFLVEYEPSKPLKKKIIKKMAELFRFKRIDNVVALKLANGELPLSEITSSNNLISTWFNITNSDDFSFLIPSETVKNDNPLDTTGMIGLHIRRTDHYDSKTYSPTTLFVEAIRNEIKCADPETIQFYLSTDDPLEEQTLKSLFGNRICCYQKRSFDRNSTVGIKDAVIDLYNLSKCKKIYASMGSSFSDVAASWGRIPKIVLSTKK